MKRTHAPRLYPIRPVVVAHAAHRRPEAIALAQRLGLTFAEALPDNAQGLAVVLTPERLELRATGPDAPGPVYADFVDGATARRARQGQQADEGLLRAAGARHGRTPSVIDATAGLGRDACLLAALGCRVTLLERHPVVASLLADGLRRATADTQTVSFAARMTLIEADAGAALAQRVAETVLLDPMHPPRRKSAAVRKEMRLFRDLVGTDDDAGELLPLALDAARWRVVVKRPRGAAPLAGEPPSGSIDGRSTRFDIYAGRAADG